MDWACDYAKTRGYQSYQSFTTGKKQHNGGIPHDVYGMTTRSIRQYTLGILEALGMKEEECTKAQTGGPDGDLGSNEILSSKSTTTAIVDGEGVVCDSNGIDKDEKRRLAIARKTVAHFKREKLGTDGIFVSAKDPNQITLFGITYNNGTEFRDNFHLHDLFTADIFVPCGGRSVVAGIVKYLLMSFIL
jgi:glutamate dehydrogenase